VLVAATRIEHVLCAVRGHRWPDLDPRKDKLPKGFQVGPLRKDGFFDVTEFCTRCGEERWYVSQPDDLFGSGVRRSYIRPADRPVIARGISRDVYGAELKAQLNDTIMAAATRAAEADETRQASANGNGQRPEGVQDVPLPVFRDPKPAAS
jgi:hypothetical protein